MPSKLSIHQQAIVLAFSASALALNPAWAEKDTDYINALGDEAKITKMKDENPVPETVPEPAVMPDKSTDIKKLTSNVTRELQKALGVSDHAEDKKTNVEDELEKMVSTALKQGNSMGDIRSAVNEAMADLKAQPGQTIKAETLESVSKALTQIVGESENAAAGKLEDNYIRSLNKQLAEQSAGTPASIEQSGTERTITVLKGESLSKIAQRIYGNDKFYSLLYKANRDSISDPNIIQIGQVLKVPELPN